MPHTSRRHRQKPNDRGPGHVNNGKKRVEITDDEGWTHVASPSTSTSTSTSNASRHVTRTTINSLDGAGDDEDPTSVHLLIRPAEAPPRLTLAELSRQFEWHSLTWTQSATCERLHAALREETDISAIERIVCIGLGSASGLVRGGWVDRRSVALYQLSALVSVVNVVDHDRSRVAVYAQDPVFNALDRSLLSERAITVVDHPAAFTLVTPSTFLFCPGAERAHLDELLPSAPAMVFGGPLEDNPSEPLARWLATTRSAKLPEFAGNSHAFWHMRLYWRDRPDAGEDDDDDDNKVTTQLTGKRG
jgi:hypothetical protein